MIVKSGHGLCHSIHCPPRSASAPTLAVFKKIYNPNLASRKTLVCPRVATVASPLLKGGCITPQDGILQSFREELDRPVLYSHHTKELETASDVHLQLADIWKDIQGSHHWNGLLNPVNPLLISEMIRYGVFVLATYEAFDGEPQSKYYGSCKYGRKSLLPQLGMKNCGYEVTKYIYAATPDIDVLDFLKNELQSRDGYSWIGYVAVSSDNAEIKRLGRRDIVVALRGTATYMEWLANFMHSLTPARFNPFDPREDVKVERGFLSLYTSHNSTCRFNNGSAREQLLSEIAKLVDKFRGEELSITITGHSMGSAIAILCAYDIAELEINRLDYESCSRIPITVYSFGGPRVGNVAFKDRCDELHLRILRIVNVHDMVTKVPGVIFNENSSLQGRFIDRIPWTYSHAGVELALDHKLYKQFFRGKIHHPSSVHDLATYLRLLTCYNCPSCFHDLYWHDRRNDDYQLQDDDNCHSRRSLIRQLRFFFEKNLDIIYALWVNLSASL